MTAIEPCVTYPQLFEVTHVRNAFHRALFLAAASEPHFAMATSSVAPASQELSASSTWVHAVSFQQLIAWFVHLLHTHVSHVSDPASPRHSAGVWPPSPARS